MNLRYQAIYQIVCEEMNMTRAAQRLDMSQPAISQVIRDIESHFQLKMFERKAKQLYLTQAGKELLKYTNELMKVHDAMEAGMDSMLTVSHYSIGVGDDVSSSRLSEWVRDYNKRNEDTSITFTTMKTETVIEHVKDRRIDMGIVTDYKEDNELTYELLHEEEAVIVCKRRELLYQVEASLMNNNNGNFLNIPLLLHTNPSTIEKDLLDLFNKKGIYYTVIGSYNHTSGIIDGLTCDLGLGILPKSTWASSPMYKKMPCIAVDISYKLYKVCRKEKNIQWILAINETM